MDAAQSTLYSELQEIAGFELGWGRGADQGDVAWDDDQIKDIKDCVRSALSRVYQPDVDPMGVSYNWSFLSPIVRVRLIEGEYTVTLPDDFHSLTSDVMVDDHNLALTPTWEVRKMRAEQPDATGSPRLIEVEPKPLDPVQGQKHQFVVWPIADQDYTLRFKCKIVPKFPASRTPHVYGGEEHGELFRAAVRAAAEDIIDGGPGPRNATYLQRLAAAISQDRHKRPKNLGYNGDPGVGLDGGTILRSFPTVTYTGGFGDRI